MSVGRHRHGALSSRPADRRRDRTTIQLAIDYDPQPPFGRIDWKHVDLLPKLMRTAIGVAAPVLAAKPKRLTRSARRPMGQRMTAP